MLAPDCVVAIAGSGSAGAARFAQTRSPSVRTRHGSTRTLGIRGQTPTPTRSPRSSGGATMTRPLDIPNVADVTGQLRTLKAKYHTDLGASASLSTRSAT